MSAIPKSRAPVPRKYLIDSDGIPLETLWHRAAINLLIEVAAYQFRERNDVIAGGNNFIYFSAEQARSKDYRGPDFYFVTGVPRRKKRRYWAIWDEGGRFPDFIMELLSPTTAWEDLNTKKTLYEQTFKTPEYFCYDPDAEHLQGWRLDKRGRYRKIKPDARGLFWSEVFQLYLGLWHGEYGFVIGTFPRFYDVDGQLVPHAAEAERQRADQLEAEVARLKAQQRRNGKNAHS